MTAENLTCIDCSRTQDCFSEISGQNPKPCRNMGESTSSGDWHFGVTSIDNIVEREGLECYKGEIIDVLALIRNIKVENNICLLSAIFYVVNKYQYLPLSTIIRYSESVETLTSLNSKISNVFYKGNLSFPLPNTKFMISFALNHMHLKMCLMDSIFERHNIIELLMINNKIYARKELSIILTLNEFFDFSKENIKYLCNIFGVSSNAYRRLLKKFKAIK